MSASPTLRAPREVIRESLRIAGEKVSRDRTIEVRHPYSGAVVGTVPKATLEDVRRALSVARGFRSTLTRHDRYRVLMKAGAIIATRRDEVAELITAESGLCLRIPSTRSGAPRMCSCSLQTRRSSTTARSSPAT